MLTTTLVFHTALIALHWLYLLLWQGVKDASFLHAKRTDVVQATLPLPLPCEMKHSDKI